MNFNTLTIKSQESIQQAQLLAQSMISTIRERAYFQSYFRN